MSSTVADLRRSFTWSGTSNAGVLRHPQVVQVTRASGPQSPGVRLGRLSRVRLGGSYGRVQVGSYFGHDLLGAADPRVPAAFAAGAALAAVGWWCGPDGDLVPGDLRVDGDGHGHLRSVGYGRTYSLGEPEANLPARLRAGGRSRWPGRVEVGAGAGRSAGRGAPAGAGEPQRAHLSASGGPGPTRRRPGVQACAASRGRAVALGVAARAPRTAAEGGAAAGSPSSRRRGRSRQAQQAARLPSRRAVGFSGRRLCRSSR